MAKIMYGTIAGAVSGAVGNQVFSHNRYGAYVRTRVIPTKSGTASALQARATLINASQGWALLTDDQQGAWRTYAQSNPIVDRLGQKQTLDGHGAYVQVNARMLVGGMAKLSLPVAKASPASLLTCSFTAIHAGLCNLVFTPTPLGSGLKIWVKAAVVDSPGVNYVTNLMKLVAVSTAAEASPFDLASAIEGRFGTLSAGQFVGIEAYVFDTASGLLSAPSIAAAIVS
jgi:hypothetical protein